MKKLLFIILLFAASFMISCNNSARAVVKDTPQVNSAQPSWIVNPKKDSEYFYVVGYTEDMGSLEEVKDKALQSAKGKIASSIFEETSVEKVFTTSGGLSDDEELRKSYKENVKSQSAVQLSGVEIDDVYKEEVNDSGLVSYKVWVLAKISYKTLEKERNRIIAELQRKLALVDNNLKQAEAFLSDGKAIDAVNAYINAAVSSTKVKERTDEFPIYINKAGTILKNLMFETGENPKSVDTGKGDSFSFILSYASDKGKVPVNNAKVNFIIRNNDGDYLKNSVTSDKGEAVCKISRLKEVSADNTMYVKLSLDFQDILDLGNDYKKYYSTLKDAVDRISASSSFKTLSSENRNIPTTVIAMVNKDGALKQLPNMASEAQSILIAKGYKVVRFSDSIALEDVYEAKQSALDQLSAKNIKRVFVLYVTSDSKAKYNDDIQRYMGVYSVSAQLIDTSNGEIISAKNIKVSATSADEKSVFDSFVKASGAQLKKLIE